METQKEEIAFLEGPQSRWEEFKYLVMVMIEFIKGFRVLHFVGPCVTIFGSARFHEDSPHYKTAQAMGGAVARLGFTVLTGGGPGIMEAANRGAKEVGGKSVGCNIVLPMEQSPNPYLDVWVDIKYFFVRKTLLIKYSYAFIVMPGGYGTLDEFFEAVTLIQTRKISDFPIVIFDKAYHKEVIEHIQFMVNQGTISSVDANMFLVTDSIEETIEYLKVRSITKFGLKPRQKRARLPFLFEED